MSHRIRTATVADIDALAEDRVKLFVQTDPTLTTAEADRLYGDSVEVLQGGFAAGTVLAWVAEAPDGRWLGSAAVCVVYRLPTPVNRKGTEAYLAQMFVVDEGRGQGIGKALLAASLDETRRRGISHMRLRTTIAGRPLYLATGFVELPDFMELSLTTDAD